MARMDTVRDWLIENPPPDGRFTQTLATVAERARHGEDLRFAVREFLDEYAVRGRDELRASALEPEPKPVDQRTDAYLAALAEHLARADDLQIPTWAADGRRSLDRMWFPGLAPGFRATALRESPVAFRRRGIFIPRGALERV